MMRDVVDCHLPAGFLDANGNCHGYVRIRALTGRDEMALHELPADASVAAAVTAILALAVVSIGPHRMTPEIARALAPSDREYLLRRLWQATFASRMSIVLVCPVCSTKMDVDLEIDALPVHAKPQQSSYSVRAAERDVVFRLPRAADVETVAERVYDDCDRVAALLTRCVLAIDDEPEVTEQVVAALPRECRSAIEAAIEEACPDAGIELDVSCPECGYQFDVSYDVATQFLAELQRTRRELQRSIHLLSFHYHWPLREILGLSAAARRRYVRLLMGELGSGRSGEAGRA